MSSADLQVTAIYTVGSNQRSTVNMAPGRYGPLSVYMAHQDGRYGPSLVDIAKTVIARLCLHYNIAIIVRKLEGWLEGKSSGNEPVSTKKPLFSNRGNLLILANNNIMSFSSLHRNTQGKRTVRTSYIVAYYCNSWSIMAGPYQPTGWAI